MTSIRTKRQNFFLILILGALTTIGPFSIDMYLPAFEKIAEAFHTTSARISLSLSSYFIGLAIGQIFYGPLLDRFGRKRPLYFGLGIYILCCFACLQADTAEFLIGARFFQALGGCVASVAAIAMVRDFFSPEEGSKVFSRLMLVLSISPMCAPTVGGWITSVWGWQSVFLVLALIVAAVVLVVFLFLPEAHQPDTSVSLDAKSILKNFLAVLKEPQFFGYAVSGAFSFAGLFTYLAGSPAIFLGKFHLSENMFGLVFAFLSIGMIGGSQVNVLLTKRFSPEQIYRKSFQVQVITAFVFAVGCFFEWYDFYAHLLIFFIYISTIGLIYPNAAALSLAKFKKNVGSASALLGTIQMSLGALASGIFGLLTFQPNLGVAIVFVMTSMTGFLVLRWKGVSTQPQ